MRVFGIFISDPGGCFFGSPQKIELLFHFFFNQSFVLLNLPKDAYLQNMDRFRVISEKLEKVRKLRGFSATESCPLHFRGRKLRFGISTPYQTFLEKKYFPAINVS